MDIRSTAKAIILHNDKILLNRCYDGYHGEYYSLPGGGQHRFETMHEAVIRECLEETGYTVVPQRFGALCEEICRDPELLEHHPQYAHKMLHIFVCTLAHEALQQPTETDSMQVASEWIDIDALPTIRLLPNAVGQHIMDIITGEVPLFLGSEHIVHNHG